MTPVNFLNRSLVIYTLCERQSGGLSDEKLSYSLRDGKKPSSVSITIEQAAAAETSRKNRNPKKLRSFHRVCPAGVFSSWL